MSESPVQLLVDGETLDGTMLEPRRLVPGVLFVHGWGGNQQQDLELARRISRLGCICFTFDLRGHADTAAQRDTVTRAQNLADLVAAYDLLAAEESVDQKSIGVIGASYGGYLAAILTGMRPVDWLGLRVPALYRDADWNRPKAKLEREDLNIYRQTFLSIESNRALRACAEFSGDVLIVESERDEIVPHPAVASYSAAFRRAHSLTYRVLDGADHELSDRSCRERYNRIVARWASEIVLHAREQQ
jgi:dienelactone hydrolase